MLWIRQMLGVYGYINRHHIQAMFRVSKAQAATDLKMAQAEWPELMAYNGAVKRYEATGPRRPLDRCDHPPAHWMESLS